ncbi:hypothetical protein MMC28_005684 [Mycoblastus sanguinarius]|nr:hypothetical protein [Mycoblastus sanguinarius]
MCWKTEVVDRCAKCKAVDSLYVSVTRCSPAPCDDVIQTTTWNPQFLCQACYPSRTVENERLRKTTTKLLIVSENIRRNPINPRALEKRITEIDVIIEEKRHQWEIDRRAMKQDLAILWEDLGRPGDTGMKEAKHGCMAMIRSMLEGPFKSTGMTKSGASEVNVKGSELASPRKKEHSNAEKKGPAGGLEMSVWDMESRSSSFMSSLESELAWVGEKECSNAGTEPPGGDLKMNNWDTESKSSFSTSSSDLDLSKIGKGTFM